VKKVYEDPLRCPELLTQANTLLSDAAPGPPPARAAEEVTQDHDVNERLRTQRSAAVAGRGQTRTHPAGPEAA